jgi:hypothetical protein
LIDDCAMKKWISLTALLLASALSACGNHEGSTCTKTDDCGGGFICQPIQGRDATYCCPAPATSSKEANCQPLVK